MNTKTDISAAYVGSTGVDKLCLGNEVVWPTTPPAPVPYEQQYFTVEANEAGTFYVMSENFNFSKNGGPWTSGVGNTAMTLSQGDKVRFKHEANSAYKGMFSGNTMSFQVYGNIESMEYGDNFSGQTRINVPSAFSQYFLSSTGLTSAENLVLSAEYLDIYCYYGMFKGCTSLTTAPELPATNLSQRCYMNMFAGCSSITTAPALPATELSLNCYNSMFSGCTSLTTSPVLPATTLASNCYRNMFNSCTNLTTAPVLPATTLASECYAAMFQNCRSLNTITCLATNPDSAFTRNWTAVVASTGTFVKDPSATGWTTGVNGIPVGWTVQDYDPNPAVLKIAGQSIPGTRNTDGYYEWAGLTQYSGTSFTIEVLGVPVTADTWDYIENYIDECGEGSDLTYETGATRSTFEVYSGYIDTASYDTNNNSVEYSSLDDQTSDDPQTICACQGGCWDGETCQECAHEDPCDDWEGAGYSSYEECNCAEHGVDCDPCDDWENMGYASYEDCTCQERGEGCESDDICENFAVLGYETWDECMCAEHGENCPEEGGEEEGE